MHMIKTTVGLFFYLMGTTLCIADSGDSDIANTQYQSAPAFAGEPLERDSLAEFENKSDRFIPATVSANPDTLSSIETLRERAQRAKQFDLELKAKELQLKRDQGEPRTIRLSPSSSTSAVAKTNSSQNFIFQDVTTPSDVAQ